MAKNSNELQQRAAANRAPVLPAAMDEADDGVEQRLQNIPSIQPKTIPPQRLGATPPDAADFKPAPKDEVAGKDDPASGAVVAVGRLDETPHVHEETDEAREARLDKQWKQLKVDVGDLPDVYARLSKFKLTGTVCRAKNKNHLVLDVFNIFEQLIFSHNKMDNLLIINYKYILVNGKK